MSGRHGNENPGGMPGDEGHQPDAPQAFGPDASSAEAAVRGYTDWFNPKPSAAGPPAPEGHRTPDQSAPRQPGAPLHPYPDGFPAAPNPGTGGNAGRGYDTSGYHTAERDAGGFSAGGVGAGASGQSGFGAGEQPPGGRGPGGQGARPPAGPSDPSAPSRGGYSLSARNHLPAGGAREPRGSGGYGPSGYGPAGYGPSGYGPAGYGPSGYGSSGYGDGGHGPGGYGGGYGGGSGGDGPDGGGGLGGGAGASGHDGRSGRRRRRSAGALFGPLAGAVALAVLLGVAGYAIVQRSTCGGGGAIALDVTAAPDIAPAVTTAVKRFNDQKREVSGHCVQAAVQTADPAAVTTLLSGQGISGGATKRPDVWIPDSSLWADMVLTSDEGKNAVKVTKTSIAQTPVVVGMPRTLASTLRSQGVIANPSWDNLLKAVGGTAGGAVTKNQMIPADLIRLQVLDPIRNAGGMASLMLTRTLLTNDPNAQTIFTGIVRTVRESATPDVKAQFASFGKRSHGRFPVILTPEQAVWKYNRSRPAEPAVAVYPIEGTMSLDYPFTVTTDSDDRAEAAHLLEQAMTTTDTQREVRALGFRSPDGTAPSSFGTATGVSPRRPRPLPAPKAAEVRTVMQSWSKLSLSVRMLTLLDISGSMAAVVPGARITRMEATSQIAQGGLSLLPDDTELGLWNFSTQLAGAQDWREVVPIGPLSDRFGAETRRQKVLTALKDLKPKMTGDTGLYDSTLAAFRKMQRTYKPEMINSLLLLTDGKNDDPQGISLRTLLDTLKREYDPERPVQVIMIGFGKGVDRRELDRIAEVTGGSVHIANTPGEIQKIFLSAMARRVCAPNC